MKPEHCKGCAHFNNAGNLRLKKFNSWCCNKGAPAAQSVGWCKTHDKKTESQAAQYLQTVEPGIIINTKA
jgi:hypothetical protein